MEAQGLMRDASQSFQKTKKLHVGLRCEKLQYEAIEKQQNRQIYRFIHLNTEIGNQYYDMKRINKSKRSAYNADPLGEEHRIKMNYEVLCPS